MNWQILQAVALTGTCIATICTAVFTGWRAIIALREYNMNVAIARQNYPGLFDKDIHGMPVEPYKVEYDF